jgi:sulfur-oxidizing protein SoxA
MRSGVCGGNWGRGRLIAILFAELAAVSSLATTTAEIAPDERRSGYDFAGPDIRAMQDDDTANPGMLWVLQGEILWAERLGAAGRSCADCHGDARTSMKGVAARYPAFDATLARPLDLEQRINHCRSERQGAEPLAWESEGLLALTAFVARQSRGLPIALHIAPESRPFLDLGKELFRQREGQLNLSCSQCHDDNWGKRLAGSVIPQGHPTGYPIYRLEWQSLGSLQRRLRGCMAGVRAAPFDYGAPQAVALEFYLMERARGMPMDAPAVRP